MSREYDEYIIQHKNNVQKGFTWLGDNLPHILNKNYESYGNILSHDQSKYDKEEYDAYDDYFYAHAKNRSHDVVQNFNKAWLHHIHHNPHHWQHWILINDDKEKGDTVLDMPYKYIIEMICDWWAFSWASDNLYEIFNWYEARKHYIKLSDKTRRTVESILNEIKYKLQELENDSKRYS